MKSNVRALVLLAAFGVSAFFAVQPAASADSSTTCTEDSDYTGTCRFTDGGTGPPQRKDGPPGQSDPGRSSEGGGGSNEPPLWVTEEADWFGTEPDEFVQRICDPASTDDGVREYYEDNHGLSCDGDGGGAPLPPPSVAEIRTAIFAELEMHAIDIGIVPEPGNTGVLGMPVWLWVSDPGPETTGPTSVSISIRGFRIDATASVDKLVWELGDGTSVTCSVDAPAYQDAFGEADSPCGHRYSERGHYTVTANSHWVIEWSTSTNSGTETMVLSRDLPIAMGEVQVLVSGE